MSQKSIKCSQCDYTATRTYNLKRHMKLVHNIVESPSAEKFHATAEKFHATAEKFHAAAEKFHAEEDNKTNTSSKSFCCSKCKKSYTRKSNLRKHEETCTGITNLQCPYCKKCFTSVKGKSHHKRVCQHIPSIETENETIGPNVVSNNYSHCTVNNNTTNNIQINITNFNSENTEYITEDFARRCFESGVHGVNPMIDKLYFEEEHPENHNVKLKSLNHSLVEIHTDKGWIPHGLYNVIDRMISNSTGTILLKIQHMPMNIEEDAYRMNAIQNITPEHKRKIRERTKSKLVARRELDEVPST